MCLAVGLCTHSLLVPKRKTQDSILIIINWDMRKCSEEEWDHLDV